MVSIHMRIIVKNNNEKGVTILKEWSHLALNVFINKNPNTKFYLRKRQRKNIGHLFNENYEILKFIIV